MRQSSVGSVPPWTFLVLACAPFAPSVQAQTATGTGQAATALFPLAAGLAIFELEHDGAGRFVVRLLTDSGRVVDTLARATGLFRGAKATQIPTTGLYLFDVAAEGKWAIRFRPAGAATGANALMERPELVREAAAAGEQAARTRSPARWLLGGFAGGALLGPIGAGAVFMAANRPEESLTPELTQSLAGKDAAYVQAFSEAYREQRRSSRKTAAVVGGTVGTIVFTFAMIQIARWNDKGGSGNGRGGAEVP